MKTLTKIVFHHKEDDGSEWNQEFDALLGVEDITLDHQFLPETGREEIVLRITRVSKQSKEYAAYVNSRGFLR